MYDYDQRLFEAPFPAAATAAEREQGKGWRRIGPAYAIGRLPRFSGRARSYVEQQLRSHGFSPSRSSTAQSATWVHPDGSQVRIDAAHRPDQPSPNPRGGSVQSHVRTHYHKLWSDGQNGLSLDDRGYVVGSRSANAHIFPKRKRAKQPDSEQQWLFEAPFPAESEGGGHKAPYGSARQRYLRSLLNDPNQPRHVRGWIKQELDRLTRVRRARQQQRRPPGGNKKRLRGVPGFDVGHMEPGNHDPKKFKLQNAATNRARPSLAKGMGLNHPKYYESL